MEEIKNNNRISKVLLNLLRTKLGLTEDGVNKKLKAFRKERGYDVTREDAGLLLASINDIDITKFADADKLKEIRELKNKEYKVEKTKTKKVEISRVIKIKDINIVSKDPHTPKNLLSDAREMSEYYVLLYVLENTLRNLIRHVFKNEPNWWKSKVNQRIQTDVKAVMDKEKYYENSRADELEYTHLDYLKQIIANNWNSFLLELNEGNKTNFQREVEKFIPSRHAVAHTTKLQGLDAERCRYRFDEIMKMIK